MSDIDQNGLSLKCTETTHKVFPEQATEKTNGQKAADFAARSIKEMQDGDYISIKYVDNSTQTTNQVELYKGTSMIESKKKCTAFTLRSWTGFFTGALVVLPWIYGIYELSSKGSKFFKRS